MTREETIKWLESLKTEIGKSEHRALWHYAEAVDTVIEALKADAVEVVRCKDCKSSRVYGKTTQWLACEDVREGQATDPDGYCYLGERREE